MSLIVGGIVLWLVEAIPKQPTTLEASQISFRQALIVGLAQLTALIPGVSRSGATIVGGLLSGLDRPAATSFSFYLAMPTLGAATVYSLVKDVGAISGAGLVDLSIGLVVSFVTALLAIGWLLRYIAKHDFRGFAVYRIMAGIVILLSLRLALA